MLRVLNIRTETLTWILFYRELVQETERYTKHSQQSRGFNRDRCHFGPFRTFGLISRYNNNKHKVKNTWIPVARTVPSTMGHGLVAIYMDAGCFYCYGCSNIRSPMHKINFSVFSILFVSFLNLPGVSFYRAK